MNLKNETIRVLTRHGKHPNDIKWIGCYIFKIPINEFWELADKEYDNGYGHAEVAQDLFIVGEDWWLERREYDGSEWWEYKQLPPEPKKTLSSLSTKPWAISLFPENDTDYELLCLEDFNKQEVE